MIPIKRIIERIYNLFLRNGKAANYSLLGLSLGIVVITSFFVNPRRLIATPFRLGATGLKKSAAFISSIFHRCLSPFIHFFSSKQNKTADSEPIPLTNTPVMPLTETSTHVRVRRQSRSIHNRRREKRSARHRFSSSNSTGFAEVIAPKEQDYGVLPSSTSPILPEGNGYGAVPTVSGYDTVPTIVGGYDVVPPGPYGVLPSTKAQLQAASTNSSANLSTIEMEIEPTSQIQVCRPSF